MIVTLSHLVGLRIEVGGLSIEVWRFCGILGEPTVHILNPLFDLRELVVEMICFVYIFEGDIAGHDLNN